jgi:hypothetical protein
MYNCNMRDAKLSPYLLFTCCLGFGLLSACTKTPPSYEPGSFRTYNLPLEAREYFPYQLGDTMVYHDSATGAIETAVCSESKFTYIKTMWQEDVLFEEEYFNIWFNRSPFMAPVRYRSRMALYSDGRQEFIVTEDTGDRFLRFPLIIGDSLSNGSRPGSSVIRSFYPSLTIHDKTFEDVYLIARKLVRVRQGSDCDYYIARHKGIVAIREYQTNRLWVLQ